MDIQMIALDLDGTALLRDSKTMSPRLLTALEEVHRRGIHIIPVTGRQFKLLPPFFQTHPAWEELAVLCNGSQVRKLATGELLHGLFLPENVLRSLLEIAQRHGVAVEFSINSQLHLTAQSLALLQEEPSLRFHRDPILKNSGVIEPSLDPLCSQEVEKVNLICLPAALQAPVLAEVEKLPVSAVRASAITIETTHPEATKGAGIARVCKLLNIQPENVMALGDSGNDLTMLEAAGLGVAMGHAPDFVKAAADAVTESNENDGAALAIERYVLNR